MLCLRTAGSRVGNLHRQRAGEPANQKIMNLCGGELLQPDDVPAERPLDLLPGLFQHLVVGEEELGPARYDDLRLIVIVECGEQGVEVRLRAFVGDAGGEFVETIENQYQSAVRQHVAEGVQVRPADLGVDQVLGDEPVDLEGLLQLPQFDEHRVDVREVVG